MERWASRRRSCLYLHQPSRQGGIDDSLFKNNEVSELPNGSHGHGGAVVQLTNGQNEAFTISDSTFAGNSAASQGGGLWMENAPTTITNTTFTGNETVKRKLVMVAVP
ncbi:MAG: hypothetical protein BRC44_03415 [Cyanobacteria bacterium QS_4_48_99]|nr:MAG: hypothetical protein BRC44_03415 [Cyanobacteria bacterium QS_4_48_99]